MDSLLSKLESFNIKNSKNDDINQLIHLMGNTSVSETKPEYTEWRRLQENYSKLLHVRRILNLFQYKSVRLKINFIHASNLYLDKHDSEIQYYLKEVNWECPDIPSIEEDCSSIKQMFMDSLNMNDTLKKLNTLITAYSKFIKIGEFFCGQMFKEHIDDKQFLEDFQHINKKQKVC